MKDKTNKVAKKQVKGNLQKLHLYSDGRKPESPLSEKIHPELRRK